MTYANGRVPAAPLRRAPCLQAIARHEMGRFVPSLRTRPTLIAKLNEARTFTERMFHTLVLDRLNGTEAREAIVRPIEIEKSTLGFSEQTIQSIMNESKGYPFLIQYVCKEVFDT